MNSKKNKKANPSSVLKYSGIAFQLAALIAVFFFLGYKLDQMLGFEKPYLAMLFVLLSFVAFMYKLNRDLQAEKDQ